VDVFIELYRLKNKPKEHPERLMTLAGRITEFSWIVSYDEALGYYFVSDASGNHDLASQQHSHREKREEEVRFLMEMRGELTADLVVKDGTNWSQSNASRYLNDMATRGEFVKEKRGKETWYRPV
jgi:hypothetical protein